MLRRQSFVLCFGLLSGIVFGAGEAGARASEASAPGIRSAALAGSICLRKRTARARATCGKLAARRHRTARVKRGRKFRRGEHSIVQISPRILRNSAIYLEKPRSDCMAKGSRRAFCDVQRTPAKGLPEALLEAPNPTTKATLRQLGIPAIKDVPPIAILRPGSLHENDHRRRLDRLR